jgi:hypothetical protein
MRVAVLQSVRTVSFAKTNRHTARAVTVTHEGFRALEFCIASQEFGCFLQSAEPKTCYRPNAAPAIGITVDVPGEHPGLLLLSWTTNPRKEAVATKAIGMRTPEERAREIIDAKLAESGWIVQSREEGSGGSADA